MSTTKCHFDDDEVLTLPLPPSLSPYLVILAPRDLFAKHIFLCRNVTHPQNRMCFEVCFIPLADFFLFMSPPPFQMNKSHVLSR